MSWDGGYNRLFLNNLGHRWTVVCPSSANGILGDISVPRIGMSDGGSFDVKPRKSRKVSIIDALAVKGSALCEAICKRENCTNVHFFRVQSNIGTI
jgi:hypothetical protein